MKKIFLLALLCLPFVLKAQQSVVFKERYMPNHTYQVSGKISLKITATVSGDTTVENKLKAEGITQPVNANADIAVSANIKTGTAGSDGSFPIIILGKLDNVDVTVGGKEVPIPPTYSEKNSRVVGHVGSDGVLTIDSADGKKADDTTQKKIKQTMGFIMRQIPFPDKPLKPGESFSRSMPINMPLGKKGGSDMHIDFTNTYKLTSISGGKAYFDMIPDFNLSLTAQKVTANVSGKGLSKMVYSIKDNVPISNDGDITIDIKVNIGNVNISGNIVGKGSTTTVIN